MSQNKRYYWLGHGDPISQDRFFVESLDKTLWDQGSADNWDTCWYTGMPDREVFEQLQPHQSINHIPGNNSVTIKSNLYDTLLAAKQRVAGTKDEARYQFFPETFSMPEDYFRFQQAAIAEPEQLWIKKPKNLSRGRGISMVKNPATIPLDSEWIIQRYLSNPHLCQGRKYVLRCYVLITSVEPLRFYWYQDGFAKLASETYSADDLDNLYRHLTNPDINEKNEEAEAAVTFISFNKYKKWLNSEGHNGEQFFNELKELIRTTVIAAREAMRNRSNDLTENNTGCYELIGLDCMVDDAIKPWIIECNLSPSLSTYADPDAGADDEVNAKRDMVNDLVTIMGLNHTPQPLNAEDKFLHEQNHHGNFECLFPVHNANDYFSLFPVPRYADINSCLQLDEKNTIDSSRLQLKPKNNSEQSFSDSLAIFANTHKHKASECILPNDIATWIWLKNSEGEAPELIINELCNTLPCPDDMPNELFQQHIQQQVWDVLADWAQANVFTHYTANHQNKNSILSPPTYLYIPIGNQTITLRVFCPIALHYLSDFCQTAKEHTNNIVKVDIIPSDYGYSLLYQHTNIINHCKLSEIIPKTYRLTIDKLEQENDAHFIDGTLIQKENKNILIISDDNDNFDEIILTLTATNKSAIIQKGFLLTEGGKLTPLNLPLKLPERKVLQNQDAIIAEEKGLTFNYSSYPTNRSSSEPLMIDHLLFASSIDNKNQPSPLPTSYALKVLWDKNSTGNIAHLTQWLQSVNTIEKAA